MTQVNLLPQETRVRHRTRNVTVAIAAVTAAAVALLAAVFLLQSSRLAAAERDLAAQESVNAELQGDISELQRFSDLKGLLAGRQALVSQVLQDQVQWSSALHDLSMVVPGQMYLTSMTATLNPVASVIPPPVVAEGSAEDSTGDAATDATAPAPTPPAPTSSAVNLVGTIQFQGISFDHPTLSLWLNRLEEVNGWVNAWINTTQTTTVEGIEVIQFSGTVDLSIDATVDGVAP